MAISKVILNGVTQIDLTSDTTDATKTLSSYTGHDAAGESFVGSYQGGSVTITDVPNATGTTCSISTGGSPTPSGIPIGVELIDIWQIVAGYVIDTDTGEEIVSQWSCCSDFTPIDHSMTFSFIGYRWYGVAFYDENHDYITGIGTMGNISGATIDSNDYAHGSINSTQIPPSAKYVRISSYPAAPDNTQISLIRTA